MGDEGAEEASDSEEDLEEGSYVGGALRDEWVKADVSRFVCEAERRSEDDEK